MSLRYIVPALGAFTLAATPAAAIEVGDLTIGGFVDAIASFTDDGSADNTYDFSGTAELQFGYAIGTAVTAQIDVEFDGASSEIDTEQAYVSYALTDKFSVTLGKMSNYLGYEVDDAPALYRINKSLVWDLNGNDIEAVALGYASDAVSVGFYISDALYEAEAVNGEELAIGARVDYAAESFSLAFNGAIDTNGPGYDTTAFNVSGDFTGVDKLTVFGDLHFGSDFGGEDVDSFGLMLAGNYVLSEKMSATLMYSMSEVDEADATQVALALLTTPTGDSNFAVNYEVALGTADGSDDTLSLAVELLAVLP